MRVFHSPLSKTEGLEVSKGDPSEGSKLTLDKFCLVDLFLADSDADSDVANSDSDVANDESDVASAAADVATGKALNEFCSRRPPASRSCSRLCRRGR